jgi:hypothetical protein
MVKLIELGAFFVFIILQGLAINGAYEAFAGGCVTDINGKKSCSGNILYMLNPAFFERNKNKYWAKPFFACVKCMSSAWGSITFWGTVIPVFGFHLFEIWVWIWDVFILVSVNWIISKKL